VTAAKIGDQWIHSLITQSRDYVLVGSSAVSSCSGRLGIVKFPVCIFRFPNDTPVLFGTPDLVIARPVRGVGGSPPFLYDHAPVAITYPRILLGWIVTAFL